MSPDARALLALPAAAALAFLTVPAAIALARRTGFLDAPVGYKAHVRPTPYLGGAAVLAAALPAMVICHSDVVDRYWPILAGALLMGVVGAADDRLNLSPWSRVAVEAGAAWLLWAEGLGWSFLASDRANLLLTVLWVIALVNAFNLMDNLDGAAGSVALVCSACVAALALIGADPVLAAIAAALCGSLAGFLNFNLASPSRIFLGDGGSMPVGFLLAGMLMSAPMGELAGWSAVVAAGIAIGLPVFDTALVVVSRCRRGVTVLTGGRDHTTHRLLAVLESPRLVALVLAGAQACLCGLVIEVTRLGESALIGAAGVTLLLAAAAMVVAEGPQWASVSDDS